MSLFSCLCRSNPAPQAAVPTETAAQKELKILAQADAANRETTSNLRQERAERAHIDNALGEVAAQKQAKTKDEYFTDEARARACALSHSNQARMHQQALNDPTLGPGHRVTERLKDNTVKAERRLERVEHDQAMFAAATQMANDIQHGKDVTVALKRALGDASADPEQLKKLGETYRIAGAIYRAMKEGLEGLNFDAPSAPEELPPEYRTGAASAAAPASVPQQPLAPPKAPLDESDVWPDGLPPRKGEDIAIAPTVKKN